MARAFGSYPEGRGFKSNFRYHGDREISVANRPGGQAAKTPPFHGGNTSSILVRVTTKVSLDGLCRRIFPETKGIYSRKGAGRELRRFSFFMRC